MKEIKLVLSAAIRALFLKKTHLAIGLILPVIIYLAVRETSRWISPYAYELLIENSNAGIGDLWFRFKLLGISLIEVSFVSLATIFFVISVHRILLARYVSKKFSVLSVYVKYCWVTLCLFPAYSIVLLPFWIAYSNYKYHHEGSALIIAIGALILALGGMSLISRVALVFPSIAIGHSITMRKSIELTRPHKLLMAVVIAFIPFLIIGLNIVLGYAAMPEVILWPFIYVKAMMFFLIEVSCLSMAYLYIIKVK